MEPVQHGTTETTRTTAKTETIEIEGDANNLGEIEITVKTNNQTIDNREAQSRTRAKARRRKAAAKVKVKLRINVRNAVARRARTKKGDAGRAHG